jgi:hypothetical protein
MDKNPLENHKPIFSDWSPPFLNRKKSIVIDYTRCVYCWIANPVHSHPNPTTQDYIYSPCVSFYDLQFARVTHSRYMVDVFGTLDSYQMDAAIQPFGHKSPTIPPIVLYKTAIYIGIPIHFYLFYTEKYNPPKNCSIFNYL